MNMMISIRRKHLYSHSYQCCYYNISIRISINISFSVTISITMSITIRKSMNIHIIIQVIGINALTLGLRQARFVGRLGETKE